VQAHVDAVGYAFVAYGVALMVLAAAAAAVSLGAAGVLLMHGWEGHDDGLMAAAMFYAIAGAIAGFIATVLAMPNVIVGVGIRSRRGWARGGGLVCGALAASFVPVGTALAVYAFVVLSDGGVRQEFEQGT
jgi:hypothetical protein